MYVYRKSAIPCMQISDCKSYSIDVRWGVNRVSRPLSVREQDKECSLYLWRIVLSQSTPFLCWHCPLSTILTNKEQMQLAFIKLMNNRFTHSQEYVEYCQIIMIIILMIKKHIVSYFMPKTIHQWLKNTNMLFHFYSLKDAFYNPVLKANIPEMNIWENNWGTKAIDARYCIYMKGTMELSLSNNNVLFCSKRFSFRSLLQSKWFCSVVCGFHLKEAFYSPNGCF